MRWLIIIRIYTVCVQHVLVCKVESVKLSNVLRHTVQAKVWILVLILTYYFIHAIFDSILPNRKYVFLIPGLKVLALTSDFEQPEDGRNLHARQYNILAMSL